MAQKAFEFQIIYQMLLRAGDAVMTTNLIIKFLQYCIKNTKKVNFCIVINRLESCGKKINPVFI